jgi:hypothetical protein
MQIAAEPESSSELKNEAKIVLARLNVSLQLVRSGLHLADK